MLRIIINKSKSKSYQRAVDIALFLGADADQGRVVLSIPEHEIPGAYESLMPLVEIIGRWKCVTATFRGKEVSLYRFIFYQYGQVALCGSENTEGDDFHCRLKNDIPTWGCRLIDGISLTSFGSGFYEKSRYWYNFGSFDIKGRWIIDKDRLYGRIMQEVEKKHLDICPYFDAARIHHLIYNELPVVIIPDNYNYRLHYQKVNDNGREIYRAVNIRHIQDLRSAPGMINRRLLHRIHTAMDYFRVNPAELPRGIKDKLSSSAGDLIENKNAPIFKAFDKDGLGKN